MQRIHPGQRLHRGKEIVCLQFFPSAPKQSECPPVSDDCPERSQGFAGNLFPVDQKENAPGHELSHGKSRGIGFAGAGGRNQQRPLLSGFHQTGQTPDEPALHGIGLQLVLRRRERLLKQGGFLLLPG